MMFNTDSKVSRMWDEEQMKDTFRRQVAQPAYTTSLISIIQAATELTALYPANVDLRAAVVQAWEEVTESMLLGKVVWNIRTKKLLGIL